MKSALLRALRDGPIRRVFERMRMKRAIKARAKIDAYATAVLGLQQWSMLLSFGKCMAGPPYGGLYISGMPAREVNKILRSLASGKTVPVHLMHRHKSGDYARSCLRLGPRRELLMVFPGREIPALSDGPKLPPMHDPHVALARRILRERSDDAFASWWNSTSSFLGGRRPRNVLGSDPVLVIAGAFDQWECEKYGG